MLSHIKTADAPRLQKLIAEGTSGESSILGHTTISGPSWSTILTGVWDTKHGVKDNTYAGARFDLYPSVFTRLETAQPSLLTESISTWGGIDNIASSGTPKADVVVTTADAGSGAATDAATADAVARDITDKGPDLIFTQLDQVDGAGHSGGTNGAAYEESIASVDAQVGKIVDAVDQRAAKTGEKWTVLVTADHGHKPTGGHGGQTPAEATTFVVARGSGYAAGKKHRLVHDRRHHPDNPPEPGRCIAYRFGRQAAGQGSSRLRRLGRPGILRLLIARSPERGSKAPQQNSSKATKRSGRRACALRPDLLWSCRELNPGPTLNR